MISNNIFVLDNCQLLVFVFILNLKHYLRWAEADVVYWSDLIWIILSLWFLYNVLSLKNIYTKRILFHKIFSFINVHKVDVDHKYWVFCLASQYILLFVCYFVL